MVAGCRLGDSANSADLLLHEHTKIELEAKVGSPQVSCAASVIYMIVDLFSS